MEFKHDNGIFIPHLSPSTVNSFITNRPGFINNKVLGHKFCGNRYTSRGTAIEHAINCWIMTRQDQDYLKIALDKYDEELAKSETYKRKEDEIKDAIAGILDLALAFYKNEFKDSKVVLQHKIIMNVPSVKREILMYLDFMIEGEKIIDCKTASRTPSNLSQSHIIQGACYQKATALPVEFDFFIDNKKPIHKRIELTLEQYRFGMSYFTQACKVIEELSCCESPTRMLELMSFPDLSSLYDANERIETAERWEIEF